MDIGVADSLPHQPVLFDEVQCFGVGRDDSDYYQSADCAVFGFKYAEPVTDVEIFEIPFGWTTTS